MSGLPQGTQPTGGRVLSASMGRSSPSQSPSTSASWLAVGRVDVWMTGVLVLAKLLGFVQISSPGRGKSGIHVTMGSGAFWGAVRRLSVNKPLPSCPDVLPVTVQSGLALSFPSSGRWPRDLHQLLCRAQPPGPVLQDGCGVRRLPGQRPEVRQGCPGGTPESKRHPPYCKLLVSSCLPQLVLPLG